MSKEIHEGSDYGQFGHFADEVYVADRPTFSKLLGPDGQPLRYEKPVLGFDLSPKRRGINQ